MQLKSKVSTPTFTPLLSLRSLAIFASCVCADAVNRQLATVLQMIVTVTVGLTIAFIHGWKLALGLLFSAPPPSPVPLFLPTALAYFMFPLVVCGAAQ
jgi:hypothetical protein